jgi:MarR family transcriptional regulator, organic hydroperoxide resistance regulator
MAADSGEVGEERTDGAPEESLLYALVDLGFALADRTNELIAGVLRELGLSVPLANALWKLNPGGTAPSMREMAASLRCDPSTVTFLADRLEERGLVERVVNPANRRSSTLVLTPKGVRVRRRLVEAMATRSPMARLSAVERRQLHHLLSKAMNTAGNGEG